MSTANAHEGQVRRVQFACLAGVLLLLIGLWANMPYLLAEHRRLELWKIAGLWCGDVMGFLWFARFAFAHAVLRDPLTSVQPGEGRKSFKLVILAGVVAVVIDLVFTLYLMADERGGYARGHVAEAQVVAIQQHRRPAATGYDLECTFKDATGARHEAHLRVLATHHQLPTALPVDAVRVLSTRATDQRSIRIRYDPRLPERAWIDGLGWEDENGLYWFSIGTACLQAALTAIFLLLLRPLSAVSAWPWWWDIYKVVPLAAEIVCMLGMGFIDRLVDSLA